jgi:O-antigen ligase
MSETRAERESPPLDAQPAARLDRLEWLFFVFVLAYGAGAILPLLVMGPAPLQALRAPDNSLLLFIWAASYLVFGLFALRHFDLLYVSLRQNPVLLALVALMLASSLWAESSALSLQHGVVVAIGTVIGAYLGARFGAEGTTQMMAVALAIGLLASLPIIVLFPHLGIMTGIHRGAWAGAFVHKNQLGAMALLGFLVFLQMAAQHQGKARRWWLGLAGLAVLLVLGSGSATALLGLVVLPVATWGLRLLRGPRGDLMLVTAWLAVIGVALVPIVPAVLPKALALFGRDLTLTGRTELWQLGFQSLWQRPLFGYGFDAFWENTSPYGGVHIRSAVGWLTPHIHNSWLELALQLGLVGVALYGLVLFRALGRAARLFRATEKRAYLFVAVFILYLCFFSVGEDVFLPRNDILHIGLVAFVVAMRRDMLVLLQEHMPRIPALHAAAGRRR